MIRLALRTLWARRRRAIGTGVAVVLGVAFLFATLVMGDTVDRSFSSTFRQSYDGTDVVVRGATSFSSDDGRQRGPIPATAIDAVRKVPGVAAVAADPSGTIQVLGADGRPVGGDGPPSTGHAWIADEALNPYRISSGRAPAKAGEVVLDRGTAAAGGLHVGDQVTILTPEKTELRLVGLASFGTRASAQGSTYAAFTPQQASDLLATPGTVTELRLRGDGSQSDAALRAAVADVLPREAKAVTGAEAAADDEADVQGAFAGALKTFFVSFAVIAVVVATFSIGNTFSIVGAQRRRESALLRAVGATRRQVLAATLVESLAIGVVATALGLAVGSVLALGLRALLGTFGLDLDGTAMAVTGGAIATSVVVGVLATLVAAIAPALRASRTAPIEALGDAAAEPTRTSRLRTGAGLALLALGIVRVVTAGSMAKGAVPAAALGAFAVLVGTVLLSAAIARPAAAALGAPIAATRGLPGRLARRNAMRNPRRTAGSALALVIGAAVVAIFATFGSSMKATINDTVDRSFGGDLVIAQSMGSGSTLSPKLAADVAELPEVAHSAGLANVVARAGGTTVYPTAGDPKAISQVLDLDVSQGSIANLQPGQIAVSDDYAASHHLRLGSPVRLGYADGSSDTLRVAATYGSRDLLGDLIVDEADWAPHAGRSGDVAVLIDLRDGVSLDQGRKAVEAVAARHGAPKVQDRDQYVQQVAGQIDQLLVLIYGLLGLAVIIALLGLANALSLSIHERRRELGVLRAVGLDRRGVRSSIRWESVITAVVGTVAGLAVGAFAGWGLVRALDAQEGFVSFQAPGGTLVVVLVLSITAGVLAAVRPARRAARIDVLDAIADR
ncbi:MAG: FtsX-like permease family protein [Acidimicrobiales bacterium]